jgi:hypothetical protein
VLQLLTCTWVLSTCDCTHAGWLVNSARRVQSVGVGAAHARHQRVRDGCGRQSADRRDQRARRATIVPDQRRHGTRLSRSVGTVALRARSHTVLPVTLRNMKVDIDLRSTAAS